MGGVDLSSNLLLTYICTCVGGYSGTGAHAVQQAALVSEWEEEEVGCV